MKLSLLTAYEMLCWVIDNGYLKVSDMEQLALYLGYIVIILIALSLIGLSIVALYATALGITE